MEIHCNWNYALQHFVLMNTGTFILRYVKSFIFMAIDLKYLESDNILEGVTCRFKSII